MNNFLKYILSLLCSAAVLMGLSGCTAKGSEEPHPAVLYDLVDVASDNGSAVFNLYRPDSDTPIVLEAPGRSLGEIEQGPTLVIAYIPASGVPYQSGEIALRSATKINNLDLSIAKDQDALNGWDDDPVEIHSIWRGGHKIYMRIGLSYSAEPRKLALVADPATKEDPIPTLYLYNSRSDNSPNFVRTYYLAVDITSLWSRPDLRGLRVIANNSLHPSASTFLFEK